MAILQTLLSSRGRSEIFRLLFGLSDSQLHVRDMERKTGLSVATVRQELQKLFRMQLVEAQRSGNRLYYRANKSHPLYTDIRNIVLKTSGMVDILRDALDKKDVKIAFVFGSVASNQEGATSDVDLMVIGDVGLRTLSGWLPGVSEQIGREINPHVINENEFRRRRLSHDHFLTRVLGSEKLFIKGSAHDLEAMVR
ncbi:MAG: nucleotidyltransferase domain-containing protein [Deltaproteobacteria bacterium]|nr:nucleotidyltransferase domain-containing protein [Deltaproteobacteria bacterium]